MPTVCTFLPLHVEGLDALGDHRRRLHLAAVADRTLTIWPLLDALLLGQLLADLDERRRLHDGVGLRACLVQKCWCSVRR